MRPHDDDLVTITEALTWQRDYVRGHGAPVAGLILDAVIEDVVDGGAVSALLPPTVRFGDLPALRVMATVHRLALERSAPAVAIGLPTLGGTPPATGAAQSAFSAAVREALAAHPPQLAAMLARTPQTNETGRAVLLRCALAHEAASHRSRPVRLWEIGASAGLNLRADHLPGDPRLEPALLPRFVERRGCDLDPVDITRVEGRLLLSSYVWVDDVDRFQRLAAAFETASIIPAELVRTDAAEFVADVHPRAGHATVLWHSAMWLYLPQETRARVLAEVARAGSEASPDAPLLHVSWEWDSAHAGPDQFALIVRRWGGGDDGAAMLLARGMSHGRAVTLMNPPQRLAVDLLTTQ